MLICFASESSPVSDLLSRNMKNIRLFLFENFQFLEVKFYVYLIRRVFVMDHFFPYRVDSFKVKVCVCVGGGGGG